MYIYIEIICGQYAVGHTTQTIWQSHTAHTITKSGVSESAVDVVLCKEIHSSGESVQTYMYEWMM